MTNGSASGSPAPTDGSRASGAVLDLLGLLAYAELVAFFRLTDDAELAPTLVDKGELAGLAATEYGHYRMLRDRLRELGADPEEAMRPFVAPLDAWHARTEPQDWLESLVKAYVGDGIAGDFYRQVAELTDAQTRDLVHGVLSEAGRAEFVAAKVRAAVADDPKLAGRLALWARRLVGEALSQAQRVATERPELAALLAAEDETDSHSDLASVSRVFARITDAHAARVKAMGLSA
ncbi:ferritin-like fold-containing protein [Marinactinospora thermotolerans]|uniref:tRNA-(MS[2]IO[6]A)-hydroxylase (MiaE)-like n=1 Tax=Marinactinospora thermotolerans DSM 45154 TaxID=1122192 RepID=A0A1T4SBX4_9ACTN|nr:ferritin-like fold-containing protein [Marinactinospora thermotolerans]SKA25616.1 tRNA-(MS[2]IO[6]A)-hydroxylase (MiaE)-like [Marinactinospora thermotolerans DSM 45154]